MEKRRRVLRIVLATIIALTMILTMIVPYVKAAPAIQKLKVHYIDVGQGAIRS